jgi:hypothetical protein
MHYGRNNNSRGVFDQQRVNLHRDFGDSAKLFVLDEVSMFGEGDLLQMNLFLQAAFPATCTDPFGGAHLIFLGIFIS